MGAKAKSKDGRELKLRQKTDDRGVEFAVVGTEFHIDRKRANESGGGIFFEGYASIFNTPDSYKDIILPGAFKKTIKEKGPKEDPKKGIVKSGIKALWQHNPDWPFGLPVVMNEDSTGLFHRTQVSATKENEDRLTYMEDTVVDGESIGFITLDSDWDEEDEDDYWPTRYIKEVDLWEISPVTFPAHSDAVTSLVRRSRELRGAVRSADHGRILITATKMKGISVPAVEEAISVLSRFAEAAKSSQGIEAEEENVEDHAVESGPSETPDPIGSGETSEEDPEFVKALEDFALAAKARAMIEKSRTKMLIGGR